ncbi:hypothetical protein EGH24_10220 [Halonotius terrestris]|uniref:Lipoprotein n=1 Tax=Halonotius terrestris TaxID=2487750 RepID=A0A8J8P8E5_9EURY|nr:DUF5803 family protein [Halonotius terrestris]TQQ79854.1 hypothetical protein EGH24_10220 [Halonotius terrestris]
MNRRLAFAIVAVLALTATAGCLDYVTGGGEIADDVLDAEPAEPYDWETDRNVSLTLHTGSEVQAVYNVSADQRLRLYQATSIGQEGPLDISAVRFRYANGTVITGTELRDSGGGEIDQTPDEVYVTLPADGQLAFSAGATPRRLTLPTYVDGSYEVLLPENSRMDFFLFSNAVPPGAQTELVDNRVRVTWDDVSTDTILVQYYQEQDLTIFAVIVALLSAIAVGGLYYYRRQIDRLHAARIEMGVDEDDDDGGRNR